VASYYVAKNAFILTVDDGRKRYYPILHIATVRIFCFKTLFEFKTGMTAAKIDE